MLRLPTQFNDRFGVRFRSSASRLVEHPCSRSSNRFSRIFTENSEKNKMFLTNVLLKKKVKSKHIMVMMKSLVSDHTFNRIRERAADKLEMIYFDPYIQMESVYVEKKKVKSMKY